MLIRGNGFEILAAGVGEAQDILSVYRRCEDFLALGPEPRASMHMVLEDLRHSREENGVFCGIYAGGEMAGVVDFVPDNYEGEPGTAFLSLLMIASEHRGRGLGRKVVKSVEAEILKNRGIREIRSGVQVNNPGGIAFWTGMGYEIAGGPQLLPDTTTVYHLLKRVSSKGF
jgi:ribosomal protein S18 acetylase RimI-like enzyme